MNDLKLLESLLNCGTVEELHVRTSAITKQLGFEHFLYGVRVNVSLTRPYHFIFSGYPKEWWEHYSASDYMNVDPAVRHCATRVIPVVWDKNLFSGRQAARIRGEAKEFGLVTGASYPVHGKQGEVAMLSLTTSRKSREADRDVLAAMGKAQLFCCYLHEAVQRIVLSAGPLPLRKVNLTEREKECLLWASEGKTGGEVADILNISERTVIFHLQNASRKLGVSTRQHAVSRALSMGLITP